MSTYITDVETRVLEAWMLARDIITLDYFQQLPESCFIKEHLRAAMKALKANDPNQRICLTSFWGMGTGSSSTYEEILIKVVAPRIIGRVEAIFTWEGGEWQTGLIIENGKVTECVVEKGRLEIKKKK